MVLGQTIKVFGLRKDSATFIQVLLGIRVKNIGKQNKGVISFSPDQHTTQT